MIKASKQSRERRRRHLCSNWAFQGTEEREARKDSLAAAASKKRKEKFVFAVSHPRARARPTPETTRAAAYGEKFHSLAGVDGRKPFPMRKNVSCNVKSVA
jgi:hypothetical protein